VTAAPVGGAANKAAVSVLTKRVGVAKTSVRIIRGERSRDKLVRVEGLASAELRRRVRADR
jgi:uncharacterized protein YggU (UPF0235/DUF167 family)